MAARRLPLQAARGGLEASCGIGQLPAFARGTRSGQVPGHGFDLVAGLEYLEQDPLWGYQRSQQDSSYDAPNPSRYGYPPRNFLITDWWDDYIDHGEETCNSLSNLNEGTMHYAYRRNYGYYCGSDRAVAVECDVTEWADQQAAVTVALEHFGRIGRKTRGGQQLMRCQTGCRCWVLSMTWRC